MPEEIFSCGRPIPSLTYRRNLSFQRTQQWQVGAFAIVLRAFLNQGSQRLVVRQIYVGNANIFMEIKIKISNEYKFVVSNAESCVWSLWYGPFRDVKSIYLKLVRILLIISMSRRPDLVTQISYCSKTWSCTMIYATVGAGFASYSECIYIEDANKLGVLIGCICWSQTSIDLCWL